MITTEHDHFNNSKVRPFEQFRIPVDCYRGAFNIALYALLTMIIAQVCDLEPGEFVHTLRMRIFTVIILSRWRRSLQGHRARCQ